MRLSFIEGVCLVAIGVAMVELHGGHRLVRPGVHSTTTRVAATPAASGVVRSNAAASLVSTNEGPR